MWTFNTVDPNAPTKAPTIVAVGVVFSVLSLTFVALRIDWTIIVTWFLALGFAIVTFIQTRWGLGLTNLSDMPEKNFYNFGLLQFIGAPFYISSILGFKLSLLFSFLRIAVERTHRIVIISIICACTAFNFSFLMAQVNLCTPISKQWDPAVVGGSCLTAVPMYTTMASITIIFDVIIMITPFPMLLKAQIPAKKKIGLLGVFSLGTFITVIQIIRILTIKSLSNSIDSGNLIMWSMVENNLGIIVACAPPLSPLMRSIRAKTSSNNRSRKGTNQRGTPYALQTFGTSGPHRDGHIGLGSGNDIEEDGKESNTVVVTGQMDNSSEEFIFSNSDHQIYRTTAVTVSRHTRDS